MEPQFPSPLMGRMKAALSNPPVLLIAGASLDLFECGNDSAVMTRNLFLVLSRWSDSLVWPQFCTATTLLSSTVTASLHPAKVPLHPSTPTYLTPLTPRFSRRELVWTPGRSPSTSPHAWNTYSLARSNILYVPPSDIDRRCQPLCLLRMLEAVNEILVDGRLVLCFCCLLFCGCVRGFLFVCLFCFVSCFLLCISSTYLPHDVLLISCGCNLLTSMKLDVMRGSTHALSAMCMTTTRLLEEPGL
jgi:hypothetical protein